jgi:DNA ligase-1
MSKREFLQQAHLWRPESDYVCGWWCSEKLDGIRAFWDGGLTIGLRCDHIPWANTAKDTKVKYSTGLWSRYGKVIHCPNWWREAFPHIPMDGELWYGRGRRQELSSIVKREIPDARWSGVGYMVFDSPPFERVFANGVIDNIHYKKTFSGIMDWIGSLKLLKTVATFNGQFSFDAINIHMERELDGQPHAHWHKQLKLPMQSERCISFVESLCAELAASGAEGLMLRRGVMGWIPERTRNVLKVKALQTGKGDVIGYSWGKKTDKGSRLLGKMGSLLVSWNDKLFSISGFNDAERIMAYVEYDGQALTAEDIGKSAAGLPVSDDFHNPMFPRGSGVTFTYRDTTDSGVPMEARYKRL